MRRDVFQAIAEPVPREIIGLIVSQPLNLNSLAEKLISASPLSRKISGYYQSEG